MVERLADSESSLTKLDKVLETLNQNISSQHDKMEECVNMLSQSFSNQNDLLVPEENHKDLKDSLEILCRLPSLFFLFTNNFNAISSMDTSTIIQKYNKVFQNIKETNEKLTEVVMYSEKCVDSVVRD